jgi:hypothetical protein
MVYRDMFDTRHNNYRSVQINKERTLTNGIIDQCQVPRDLTGRGREPEGGIFTLIMQSLAQWVFPGIGGGNRGL